MRLLLNVPPENFEHDHMTNSISDKVFLVRVDPSCVVVQYPYEDGFLTFWDLTFFP